MKIKRSVAVLGVTGATAAALFGGTAVHTALTSDSPQTVGYAGATVNDSVRYGPPLDFGNMQPGDVHQVNVALDNTKSTVPVEAYWVPNGFTATSGNPNINDIAITQSTDGGGILVPLPVASHDAPVALGEIPAGQTVVVFINSGLAQSTGNSWNGASGVVHYTIHFQDINKTDGSHYVPTSNG